MTFPVQPNFTFLDTLGGEGDCLAQTTAAQQQQMAAMAIDGRSSASPYFLNGHALNSNMYGVNPLVVEPSQIPATLAAASTGGAVGTEGRRRSPTNSTGRSGATPADHAQRRATHNAIERARRESLNGQFQDLASAVPALIHVRRPSKATIVEKSLEYIRTFKEHLGNRDQYIKKLQLRNLSLHDEVNRLRNQLGLEPLAEASEIRNGLEDSSASIVESAEESDETKEPVQKAGSPLKTVVNAAALDKVSTPANLKKQTLPLQKRRQSEQCTGRPVLRVHTADFKPKRTSVASSEGNDLSSSNASASASPLLQASPLSAPLLTHAPQLPQQHGAFTSVEVSQQAAAAAAAFVAHTGQHSLQTMPVAPLTAAQLSAMGMGMSMPMGMATPSLSSPLQVGGPMGGYLVSAASSAQPQMSVIDMAKFSEVFATSSASAMPMMTDTVDTTGFSSPDVMSYRISSTQFSGVSQ
ncbi:hypothetical protein COEREDRAFT_11782 [Coemansia reversa NRRL 1564]|uniref:BHLH domain-containing protein n=1 Tax=Coemansia reversa (strain ATCC 12441 / NRRL 1564) TaxID=763665 RepID=A0A2G5B288_COERN|nr:hypothetical protein COEREDRAFT_11782 [Coemansia reversa NRRL 1564]|eukprot:PIA13129.1 hypothetical protein COEREDRAFT_11782 [Coemansia reversa NRRL 1564]